jgi:hypothetical protein
MAQVVATASVWFMSEATKPIEQTDDDESLLFRLWSNRHQKWWKPSALGYTSDEAAAGLYALEDAIGYVTKSARSGVREHVTVMVAAGRFSEEPEAAEETVPEWADDLLRAYLCRSCPLDFKEHSVPDRVQRRIEEVTLDEAPASTHEPHRPFRQTGRRLRRGRRHGARATLG